MKPAAAVSPARWALRTLQSLVTLTLAMLAMAAASPAWADPPGRVGRISDTEGTVWLYEDDEAEWVQARRNRPLTEGDRISVESGGRAEVQIGSATLRLDGATDVEFAQLDDARVRVFVHGGSAALRVRGGEAAVREFALQTREGRYEPLRPGHYRVDVEERSSLGETLAGAMRFEAHDSVLDIGSNQRAEFWTEGDTTHYAWASVSGDRFGDWVARADREESRERNRYVSPEMTGAEDLDRYGRWDRHPEYGAVWYPTAVDVGWAPYRYGHWAYVRPWGWTWVDDARWGFAPFHYGRWVNYGGRWGWCPGQYVARPVYAPALVAWFGGPNLSIGINIGGPAVGWVPLAPREVYYPSYNVTNIYVRNVNGTHRHWHGPSPRYERTVPTGPIMYTNQGVAGGVTVVPQAVVQSRQPISPRVVVPVDSRTVARWQAAPSADSPRGAVGVPPAPPPSRVVARPGGAVPAAPGAVRPTPWNTAPSRVGATQGDGGRTVRTVPTPPARSVAPPGQQQRGDDARGARGRDGNDDGRAPRGGNLRDERSNDRRIATPTPQPPQGAGRPAAPPAPAGVMPPRPAPQPPTVASPQPSGRSAAPPAARGRGDGSDDDERVRGAPPAQREAPVMRPAPTLRDPPEQRERAQEREAERRPNGQPSRGFEREPRGQQNR
jgi:hypothetical protein